MVVEDELDRHQLQCLALEVQRDGINEFQMVGGGQRAPGVFFGREVQVHNRAMLRQVQPPLAAPDLFELLLGELALFEQEVAGFLSALRPGWRSLNRNDDFLLRVQGQNIGLRGQVRQRQRLHRGVGDKEVGGDLGADGSDLIRVAQLEDGVFEARRRLW